ncbi:MAG: EAL domain-containing protein [Cyanothece sp. SIO2G6]|nr:EAL domain-containing protein [Cyanothece sp. SIO2G6]
MRYPSVLVVDDEVSNFDIIEGILSQNDLTAAYQLHYAPNGEDAIASLELFNPDLILLDVMMPGIDGLSVCRQLKVLERWQSVPIIMVTALSTKDDLVHCLAAGADDFLGKPIHRLELVARVQSMLRIRQQYLRIQQQKQQLETFNAQLDATVQQRTADLRKMVFEDALTQLPNRIFLLQELTQLLQQSSPAFALVTLGCNQFKLVNASFGHAVGDRLLVIIAKRLKQNLQAGDILARLGSDEFCFLLSSIGSSVEIEPFVRQVMADFDAPFVIDDCEIFLSVCLGITITQDTQRTPEELLQNTDTAMYQAKAEGDKRSSYCIFAQEMQRSLRSRLTLESSLQRALEQDEFVAYYQPIIQLQTQRTVGFEALVRWQHPARGLIPPGVFIPSMETTGLIVPAGIKILQQACHQLSELHQRGYEELTMSVNLSVRQFASATLIEDIDQVLAETQVNPACLKFEITESALMGCSSEMAIGLVQALRSRHIQICLDDFGTGYSSLSYLHQFPINHLKIDKSFVGQIDPSSNKNQILETIVTLGHQLDLVVVAEGIETNEQLEYLQQLGCELGQGYLFARPLDAASAFNFLGDRPN